jgi:cytoskeleton protein RodZ
MTTEIGSKLKARREELGLTLQEASLALKINSRILEAIEENKVENLPPRTFLRGFIQSYGSYLRMDVNLLLDLFQQDSPAVATPRAQPTVGMTQSSTVRAAGGDSKNPLDFIQPKSKAGSIVMGILAVVLVLAILGILRMIEKYQSESMKQPVEVTETLPEPAAPHSDSSVDEVPTANSGLDTSASTNPTDAAANSNSTAATAVTPTTPTPTTPPPEATKPQTPPQAAAPSPAVPAIAKTPAAPAATPPTPQPPSKPDTAPTAAANTNTAAAVAPASTTTEAKPEAPQELIIEALDKVTVDFQIDDEPRQSIKLNAEELRTLKAKRSIQLRVSDGGSINIVHNGRDRGVPGQIGQPITLNYPRKSQ